MTLKVAVPPIKSQGIKTKLVPWINSLVPDHFEGRWIEPFMGTGVVAFNLAPRSAMLSDTNPHLINFYTALRDGEITPPIVREFLEREGQLLLEKGEEHYYYIRERFNDQHSPLDFLFLNRSGFNGMIRFNRKGGFNIPFCKKPNRFAPAYVTKIVNQVTHVARLLETKEFEFRCQGFEEAISEAGPSDLIYCDPPYIGRHVDYFNSWDDEHEQALFDSLCQTDAAFILSTWHHNDYRKNEYIDSLWERFGILTREHFYHVGGSEKNRNPMIEAIITNMDISGYQAVPERTQAQIALLEPSLEYDSAG